ncbi:PIG-L deacetylase family protein [Actinomycetota bacterium Odt1-20B]
MDGMLYSVDAPEIDRDPPAPARSGRTVLAVGAHPDDIELGCAATLRAHVLAGDRVVMLILTDGCNGPGAGAQLRRTEQDRAARRIGAEVRWGGFRDGELGDGLETIRTIEGVLKETGATTVYTHGPDDTHQDHRAASRAASSAARHAERLLFFESPSSVNFQPQLYIDVSGCAETKLQSLRAHASQVSGSRKVDLRAVDALMRVRGFQSGVEEAEGFRVRRFVYDPRADARLPLAEAEASALA